MGEFEIEFESATGSNELNVVRPFHSGLDLPNRFGAFPFHPISPQAEVKDGTGTYNPDLSRPNPAYFEFVDYVVDTAATLGIVVGLVPSWGRYVNGGECLLPPTLRTGEAQG